jgi:ferredoxin-NADP reductase
MIKHVVRILNVENETHNVKRFVLEKPDGYVYVPGQATDVSINQSGLEDVLKPFTLTSLNEWHYLEFTIKIYNERHGFTERLGMLKAGDELILHEVFGTIHYKGPGVFIAGGAGITPFIAIFRQLNKDGLLAGNTLLFANHNENDIIHKAEFDEMLGEHHIDVLRAPLDPEIPARTMDYDLLKEYAGDMDAYYYVCGPDPFTAAMVENLEKLGVEKSHVVIEE